MSTDTERLIERLKAAAEHGNAAVAYGAFAHLREPEVIRALLAAAAELRRLVDRTRCVVCEGGSPIVCDECKVHFPGNIGGGTA
jgi:hypothetical protein